ncbi:hypothetical protein CLF_100955 [Clonorchis sinensis]|uniref:Uncharacterized protein n=1 Tax=Clonorchis sinensis TaxID=79923 RepID=G7Y4M4_CLOSI|nr:hypothetical protein CLF_100955 [Clonorchis sinensis]
MLVGQNWNTKSYIVRVNRVQIDYVLKTLNIIKSFYGRIRNQWLSNKSRLYGSEASVLNSDVMLSMMMMIPTSWSELLTASVPQCLWRRVTIISNINIILDNITSVFNTDALLPYNYILFESPIVKNRIKMNKTDNKNAIDIDRPNQETYWVVVRCAQVSRRSRLRPACFSGLVITHTLRISTDGNSNTCTTEDTHCNEGQFFSLISKPVCSQHKLWKHAKSVALNNGVGTSSPAPLENESEIILTIDRGESEENVSAFRNVEDKGTRKTYFTSEITPTYSTTIRSHSSDECSHLGIGCTLKALRTNVYATNRLGVPINELLDWTLKSASRGCMRVFAHLNFKSESDKVATVSVLAVNPEDPVDRLLTPNAQPLATDVRFLPTSNSYSGNRLHPPGKICLKKNCSSEDRIVSGPGYLPSLGDMSETVTLSWLSVDCVPGNSKLVQPNKVKYCPQKHLSGSGNFQHIIAFHPDQGPINQSSIDSSTVDVRSLHTTVTGLQFPSGRYWTKRIFPINFDMRLFISRSKVIGKQDSRNWNRYTLFPWVFTKDYKMNFPVSLNTNDFSVVLKLTMHLRQNELQMHSFSENYSTARNRFRPSVSGSSADLNAYLITYFGRACGFQLTNLMKHNGSLVTLLVLNGAYFTRGQNPVPQLRLLGHLLRLPNCRLPSPTLFLVTPSGGCKLQGGQYGLTDRCKRS